MAEQFVFTAKVNDFEMDYIKFGSGSKIFVVLPGMSLKSVMLMAPLCVERFKIYTHDYTIYLFDRRKEFKLGYSIGKMAEDTVLTMKNLGIINADILGISQGGMIAQSISENYPDVVNKLVLGSSASRINEASKSIFEEWISYVKKDCIDEFISSFVDKVYTEQMVKQCKLTIIENNHSATEYEKKKFIAMAESCIIYDENETLSKIKCPTFILGAKNDKVLTPYASLEIYDKLKSCGVPCKIYMYEGYNHGVYDEASDYHKRILDFLKINLE